MEAFLGRLLLSCQTNADEDCGKGLWEGVAEISPEKLHMKFGRFYRKAAEVLLEFLSNDGGKEE